MEHDVAVVYGDAYHLYKFSEAHPLSPLRVELTMGLIESLGLLDSPGVGVVRPRSASDEELEAIHDRGYVEAVKAAGEGRLSAGQAVEFGLGPGDNPVFPKMHEASAWVAGGSLIAAETVLAGKAAHAFNPAGGLHHALRDKASGFCVYNDAVLACARLAWAGKKVVYLDTDAHHGDGVQWAFYGTPEVLTISVHESGRYLFPGTGFVSEVGEGKGKGYSVNVPLPPGCYDDAYLFLFGRVVSPIIRAFAPDVIVSQNGCDGHNNDPLTHLSLTTKTYRSIYRDIHALAHEVCGGRLIALGGGGYDLYDAVPRIWSLLVSEIAGVRPPNAIPEEWRKECRSSGGGLCPVELDDYPSEPRAGIKADIESSIEKTLDDIRKTVFPFFGLS
ncbi:MAG: acetoin utilization protein AcuC [Candidatus Aquicultorales bacterium]